MPASIRNKTLATITEQGVKLENAQIFRKLKNNDWNTIQISLRMIMDDSTGAKPTSDAVFGVGLCNGNSNGLGSVNRGHIVCSSTYGTTGTAQSWGGTTTDSERTWVGVAMNGATNAKFVNDVFTSGGVWTASTGTANFLIEPTDAATGFWNTCFYFRITKGSPNWTLTTIFNGGSGTLIHRTRPVWLSYAEASGTDYSNFPVSVNYTVAARSLAVDEDTDGVLDHVNVWWNRSAPSILITDIAVSRLG